MPDLFSTDSLVAIIEDLRTPKSGLAARYFNTTAQDTSEEIHFDIDNKPRRIAPFVSPLVAGQIVQSRGFQTSTFKPAYVKDKRVFTPGRTIRRVMGERIGGGDYSPEQRRAILLAQDVQDQVDMLERRFEIMAAKILYDGKITIEGEQYPAKLVDFGRKSALTINSGKDWAAANAAPLDDLQDWSDLMVKETGVALTDVTMTVDVWKVFRKNAEVKTRLDRWRGNSTMQQDAHQREGLVFQGMVDQFAIYTYSGWHIDPGSNTEVPNLPAGTVIGTASPEYVEGVRQFGAILDEEALVAMDYFPKSWVEPDPSVRYLLLQSAPLLVPYRVNATFRAKVL